MTPRRILVVAAAVLVLLLGGLVLAAFLIPGERVADSVARRAEAALGYPVALGDVGISIFPLPGVRISDLTVGPDTAPLARVAEVDVRVRILPLFTGRVVVGRLDVTAPDISVEVDATGSMNFPVIGDEAGSAPEDGGASVAFAVNRIRVSDGSIRFANLQDGTRVALTGWNQELSLAGQIDEGALTSIALEGRLAFDDIQADFPGAVLPARDLSLELVHDASLDLSADRLDLQTLEATVDGITLTGSGQVRALNSGRPEVQLELAADGLEAGRLLAWVPDSFRARMALPDGRTVEMEGTGSLRATIDGIVAPDTLPAVDGILTLDGVSVTLGGAPVLEAVGGRVAFSTDSVVARFDGRALGETFNAGAAVRNPSEPMVVVAVSGGGDLGRLQALGVIPDTLGLSGTLQVDLRAQVAPDDPAAARATGTVELSGVAATGTDPVIRVPAATARFDGGRLTVSPMRLELGPERAALEVEAVAEGWIPAALGSGTPASVAATLSAGILDLDALMGPSESGGYAPLLFARLRDRPLDGRRPEEIAEAMGLGIPALPPVQAVMDLSIAELIKNGLHYTDLEARITATPDAVVLDSLRFGFLGGTVVASGRAQPVELDSTGVPTETRITGQYAVTDVGGGPFFDRLTPFRDHLAGTLGLEGTLGLAVDRWTLPVRSSLEAGGDVAITDGLLANWTVLEGVANRLEAAVFDTLRFRDWAGRFAVEGTRITLAETTLEGDALDAGITGWFDVGGALDVQANTALSPELAARAGALGAELASTDGRVPVGLAITGSVESPQVSLDLTGMRDVVAGRARDAVREAEAQARTAAEEAAAEARQAVEEEVRGLADEATREAARRFSLPDSLQDVPADSLRQVLGDSLFELLPDSTRLRADSLQRALENALRDRLRRLLPGGGGG